MDKTMVEKSHYAMQWLIRRLKFVSPRNKGIETLTIKTHLVIHLAEDMLDHGVPSVVNSANAESAHIELAKVTSTDPKRFATFVVQSSNRYIENLAIARGQFEIMKLETQTKTVEQDHDKSFPKLDGARFIFKSCNTSTPIMKWHSSHHDFPPTLPCHVINFLAKYCTPKMPGGQVLCHAEARFPDGQTYRAHPCLPINSSLIMFSVCFQKQNNIFFIEVKEMFPQQYQ